MEFYDMDKFYDLTYNTFLKLFLGFERRRKYEEIQSFQSNIQMASLINADNKTNKRINNEYKQLLKEYENLHINSLESSIKTEEETEEIELIKDIFEDMNDLIKNK